VTLAVAPHIVILGGGFAGVAAARESARLFERDKRGRITLVDRHNYQLFTPMLTFVVGGGGFSGVETMAALNDLVRDVVRHYPKLRSLPLRMVLIHPGDRLLPELGAKLAGYAQRQLERRGVEVLLNAKIADAGSRYVVLEDSRRIDTHLLVWAAGVKPSPVIATLECPRGPHGGILVEPTLAVQGYPGVWALGDCAEIPRAGDKGAYGPTAQNAGREGILVARNIAACLCGGQLKSFDYTPLGELALVGKHTGVANLYGRNFSGAPAWVIWRMVYLAKVPLLRKRLRIGLDWLLDLVLGREIVALPLNRFSAASDLAGGASGGNAK
jgi:NADH dehydrogenase